jgi:hypothetical protein
MPCCSPAMPCPINSHTPCRTPAILRQYRVLHVSSRGSRKKLNAGRSPTCHLRTADADSHMPCHAPAVMCRGLEKSLWECHDRGVACVNQTRLYCVNQVGKTQSKPLMARHGRGMRTVWYVWISLYNSPVIFYHCYTCACRSPISSPYAVAYRGGCYGGPPPPRNSDVLPKLSRIPSSVEYTSVTT